MFNYRYHNSPPPAPTLNQISQFHTLSSYFFNIHMCMIIPFAAAFPKPALFFRNFGSSPLHV